MEVAMMLDRLKHGWSASRLGRFTLVERPLDSHWSEWVQVSSGCSSRQVPESQLVHAYRHVMPTSSAELTRPDLYLWIRTNQQGQHVTLQHDGQRWSHTDCGRVKNRTRVASKLSRLLIFKWCISTYSVTTYIQNEYVTVYRTPQVDETFCTQNKPYGNNIKFCQPCVGHSI